MLFRSVPLPSGPPHPAFPKTLLAFHLLTEDELDSIAHHYHQSTPGPWTHHYPALMNWDKGFLARRSSSSSSGTQGRSPKASAADVDAALEADVPEEAFLETLMTTVRDLQREGQKKGLATLPSSPEDSSSSSSSPSAAAAAAGANAGNPYAGLSDKDRIRIKRRKVGKFIGLVGMETPVEEIAGRIQASVDRAVGRSREELRRNEEIMLRRSKMA